MVRSIKAKILSVGLVTGMLLTGCGAGASNSNVASSSNAVMTKVDLGDKQPIADEVAKVLDDMFNGGAYFSIAVSDNKSDDIIFIYNKDKSCYAETSAGCPLYYDTKGNLRIFTSPYEDVRDISPLMLTYKGYEMAQAGQADLTSEVVNIKDLYENVLEQVKAARETETEEDSTSLTVEEEAANIVGYDVDDIGDQSYDNMSIKISGRDNIYKLYESVFGNHDEAVEFVDEIFSGDDNKEDDAYEFIVHHSADDSINGVMLKIINSETSESIGWYFDGYYALGGDWKSLGDGWFDKELDADKVKEDIQGVVTELAGKMETFKNENFTPEQIEAMDKADDVQVGTEETESTEASDEVEGAEPSDTVASIVREGSFKETIDNLLKEDSLSEVDTSSFKVPEGYEDTDKARMIDLYNKLVEWDASQQDGTLISPISPDDVEFAENYIKACEDAYNKTVTNNAEASDEYGTVYWKDTVEIFIKAIQ